MRTPRQRRARQDAGQALGMFVAFLILFGGLILLPLYVNGCIIC